VSESFVLVSDERQHTKLIDYLIRFLKDKYPAIKKINVFFSDGASSQFKQRFLFSNLYL